MTTINNYFEPNRLLVSWQQPEGTGEGHSRSRHVIAEIYRNDYGVFFRYFADTREFNRALEKGFSGLPAFKILPEPYGTGVIDTFIRRLPPRRREDFKEYLNLHMLPSDFNGSDFALLAYTGAKLPSDGFEIFPDLTDQNGPYEFIFEAAGTRYLNVDLTKLNLGDSVDFKFDPNNAFDPNAINIFVGKQHIGFVPKPYQESIKKLLSEELLTARIEKLNGKPDHPLIYLFAKVI